MKQPATQKPTRISTVTVSFGGFEWTASATSQAEALEAIARAAEQERTASK